MGAAGRGAGAGGLPAHPDLRQLAHAAHSGGGGRMSAIAAALAEMEAFTSGMDADPAPGRRNQASGLDRKFRQMDRELVATRTHMAGMEAKAALMRARPEQAEGPDARAIPAAPAPKQAGHNGSTKAPGCRCQGIKRRNARRTRLVPRRAIKALERSLAIPWAIP